MAEPLEDRLARLASAGNGGGVGALVTLVGKLSAAASLEEIMSLVTLGARSLLHADGASFVLRDGDRCFYAEEDAVSPLWKGRRFPLNACVSGWCMTHRQTAAIRDIYEDPRVPADAYRPTFVRSLAMAPVGQEQPIAALGAYWSVTREFRPEELELLQTIANAAALAVAYVQLQQAKSPSSRAAQRPAAKTAREPEGTPGRDPPKGRFARLRERLRGEAFANSPAADAVAAACAVAATLARLGVDALGVSDVLPYATYFPATLLAVLVGGAGPGLLAAAFGGGLGYWAFVPPDFTLAAPSASGVLNLALYFGAAVLMIWMLNRYRRALLRLTREDARVVSLAREQHHRTQNAVSVVEAIVRQSLRGDPLQARVINQRIRAGLASIELGPPSEGRTVGLGVLLRDELQPFDLSRFGLEGHDETPLAPELRSLVTLAAHELAINALKYGALASPEGRVAIDWDVADGRVTLRWRESGGPPVTPPDRRGYGSILLRRLVEANHGALSLDFAPAGLVAEIVLPLEAPRR